MHDTTKTAILKKLDEIGKAIEKAIPDEKVNSPIFGLLREVRKMIDDEDATPRSVTVRTGFS